MTIPFCLLRVKCHINNSFFFGFMSYCFVANCLPIDDTHICIHFNPLFAHSNSCVRLKSRLHEHVIQQCTVTTIYVTKGVTQL